MVMRARWAGRVEEKVRVAVTVILDGRDEAWRRRGERRKDIVR